MKKCLFVSLVQVGLAVAGVFAAEAKTDWSKYKWAVVGDSLSDPRLDPVGGKYYDIIQRETGIQIYTNVADTVSHCFIAATDGEPKFKSPKKGAFHLRSISRCLNAGDNTLWDGVADPVDLDGTPRIRNGIVDIGCFEGDQSGVMLIVR